jgi:putative methyltransferase
LVIEVGKMMHSGKAKRRKVWLHQFVHFFSNEAWLPISIGLIAAHARANRKFDSHFEILDFQYERMAPEKIVAQYEDPSILAFSTYIWNVNLSLEVARLAHEKFPDALIVFGGPSAPADKVEAEDFLRKHPFIDFLVSGEGETAFLDFCLAQINGSDLKDVLSLSWLNNNEFCQTPERKMTKDMDDLASPYLNGTFDCIVNGPHKFHAIWETNRGCPFPCGFCYWGHSARSKIVRAGRDRVEKEIEWFGKNKIELLYIADSNFGWVEQDKIVAQGLVKTAEKYGYPKKVLLTWAKNANDNCFEVAKILNSAGLCYPITLSYQSLDKVALENIQRTNITLEHSKELRKKYLANNMATYTDLLLGVPGETFDSFIDGVEKAISYGEHDQFQIYPIRILPNTDMARKEYIQEHGIKTVRVPLQAKHGSFDNDLIKEMEDIIVKTNSMPTADWKRMVTITWFIQSFFCLKSAYFVCLFLNLYLKQRIVDFAQFFIETVKNQKTTLYPLLSKEMDRVENYLSSFLNGDPKVEHMDMDLPKVRWPIEEVSFLKLSLQRESFYEELRLLVDKFIASKELSCDSELLNQVFDYQQARLVNVRGPADSNLKFDYNLPQFFEAATKLNPIPLKLQTSKMQVIENYQYESLADFAQYHVWYGRQGKKFYYKVTYDKQIENGESDHSALLTAIPTINT